MIEIHLSKNGFYLPYSYLCRNHLISLQYRWQYYYRTKHAYIIPIQTCSPDSAYPGIFKDITIFSKLSIFKPPDILPCIITFLLMWSHLEPHKTGGKSLLRLVKVSVFGLGREIINK